MEPTIELVTTKTILVNFYIMGSKKRKCAQESINCIEHYLFAYLGVPKILQSDNGREFDNEVTILQ